MRIAWEMEEPRNALKGQQQLAQGSALGEENGSKLTPYRGKSFCTYSASYLARPLTQGAALGYEQVGPSGRSMLEATVQTPKLPRPMTYEL